MSLSFSADELADMKTAQEAHMMDECVREIHSQTKDNFGTPVDSWPTDGATLPCGLDQGEGSEELEPGKTVIRWDATLRLPAGTTMDEADRIRITKRFGTAITPIRYGIVSPPRVGPSGMRLRLKRIEPSKEAG